VRWDEGANLEKFVYWKIEDGGSRIEENIGIKIDSALLSLFLKS
jgi:hypothetical protein